MKLSYRKIFLIDGAGAMVTALLLSQVLARFETAIGMPGEILYVLAGIAGCFAICSLSCAILINTYEKFYLKGIAIANTLYCITILGLIIYLRESMTWLGVGYFAGEIVVVMSLVRIEWMIAKRN